MFLHQQRRAAHLPAAREKFHQRGTDFHVVQQTPILGVGRQPSHSQQTLAARLRIIRVKRHAIARLGWQR